ncbi:MAG: M20/M25/M40 family metallo-hydrolase [Chitinophagaceae bacterium]
MKRIFLTGLLVAATSFLWAQQAEEVFRPEEAGRILRTLASDEMRGRKIFTPEIEQAADFIASEFKAAGLEPLANNGSFRQEFSLVRNKQEVKGQKMANVVGVLPGKSLKNEFVIFSGHYDHIGVGRPVNGDSIYNGANDDAAGITAVILLARYFKAMNNNERTLVFAAFTGEESGGLGSRYFSQQFNSDQVMAMFNIEMIGTDSKWGKNSAYITGYEKTDMGEILSHDLEGSGFTFYPDPYPTQQLFYRSDNATFARKGVPAHTISTSKMDVEPFYHKPGDEIETLDMENMAAVIKAIGLSAQSIITGKKTPSRVKTDELR